MPSEEFEPGHDEVSPRRSDGELVLGILTVLGACFAVIVALLWRTLDCSMEDYSTCRPGATPQLWVAFAGLLPAVAMVVDWFRPQGRPMGWFLVTIAVYVLWLCLVSTLD